MAPDHCPPHADRPLQRSAGSFVFRWDRTNARTVISATFVLSLGIIGNAILPVPYAFSITGATAGVIIFSVVALANRYTCRLLLRGAVASGTCDYEGLADAVGGPRLRWAVEISIVLLLLGTIAGSIVQIGQSASAAVSSQWPGQAGWWVNHSGMTPMIIFTLGIILPLCMLPSMRQLEVVGAAGSLIVYVLTIVIVVHSCINGLPELGSGGSFAAVGFSSLANISQAFSLAGFAFYLQALMMPLLSEFEPGPTGAAQINIATTITILGPALITYLLSGFFGAAMYGSATNDNLLENEWLPGVGTFILNLLVTFYLVLSVPPLVFANVHTVRSWVDLATKGWLQETVARWVRQLISTLVVLGICLGIALGAQGASGTVLTFTGATFVAIVSYICPVTFHYTAYYNKARFQKQKQELCPLTALNDLDAAAAAAGLSVRFSISPAANEPSVGAASAAGSLRSLARLSGPAAGQLAVPGLPAAAAGTAAGGGGPSAPSATALLSPFESAKPPIPAGGSPRQSLALSRTSGSLRLRRGSALASIARSSGSVRRRGLKPYEQAEEGAEGGWRQVDTAKSGDGLNDAGAEKPAEEEREEDEGVWQPPRLVDMLHLTNTMAPQRSRELGDELSGESSFDRQALFREALLRQSLLYPGLPHPATASLAGTLTVAPSAVSEMLEHLDTEKMEEVVLALLPSYRSSQHRHWVIEAAIELLLPALVLALGLFFSVSTLVLLFQ